jgi:anti-sigma B factor antagonist
MPLNIRIDGDIVIMSNFAKLMNDPRYVDASRDADELLDQGLKKFILDLGGVKEKGSSFLALLLTLTRRIRRHGGDAVIAHAAPDIERVLSDMRMDDYWDIFKSVAEATQFFTRKPADPLDDAVTRARE